MKWGTVLAGRMVGNLELVGSSARTFANGVLPVATANAVCLVNHLLTCFEHQPLLVTTPNGKGILQCALVIFRFVQTDIFKPSLLVTTTIGWPTKIAPVYGRT